MADDTRLLRNAQANLIAVQAQRIAKLELDLEVAKRTVAGLEEKVRQMQVNQVAGKKSEVQA